MIAVVQGRSRLRQQAGEPLLALDQRPCGEILAVEIKKIEQKEHEAGGVAGVGRQLDHAERGDAVGAHAAQFAVEIGLARGRAPRPPGRSADICAVQSSPLRVSSRTSPWSSRACMRKPSYLISCSHWSPSGASLTSCVSCGRIQSGRAAVRRVAGASPAAPMPGAGRGLCAGAWALLRLGKSRRAAVAIGCQFR